MRNNSFTITNLPNGGCHRGGVEFDGVYFNGHQPTHKHGKYFIVVGEIYNGDELFCVSLGYFLVISYNAELNNENNDCNGKHMHRVKTTCPN